MQSWLEKNRGALDHPSSDVLKLIARSRRLLEERQQLQTLIRQKSGNGESSVSDTDPALLLLLKETEKWTPKYWSDKVTASYERVLWLEGHRHPWLMFRRGMNQAELRQLTAQLRRGTVFWERQVTEGPIMAFISGREKVTDLGLRAMKLEHLKAMKEVRELDKWCKTLDDNNTFVVKAAEGGYKVRVSTMTVADGGFSRVYAGREEKRIRFYAVKESRDFVTQKHRIEREIRIWKRLTDEAQKVREETNIVKFTGIFYLDGDQRKPFLVSQLAEFAQEEHSNADSFVRAFPRKLPVVISGIINGISFIHGCGVAHGDICPQNIVMCGTLNDPVPRFVDFGLAKIVAPVQTTSYSFAGERYRHMAPEILGIRHRREDEEAAVPPREKALMMADIWSFAMVMLELLTKCRPLIRHSDEVLSIILTGNSESKFKAIDEALVGYAPYIPPSIRQIVTESWAAEPTARPRIAAIKQHWSEHKATFMEEVKSKPYRKAVKEYCARSDTSGEAATSVASYS